MSETQQNIPPLAGGRVDWWQVLRYYQAGIVNTLFGFGCYALLVWLGMDMFLAQLISHTAGTLFNYLTYSSYTFKKEAGSLGRFVLSYAVNYLLSLSSLWALSQIVTSPYASGLLSIVVVSVINFVILKCFVFRSADA
jgi:putative flippase GtrA